MKLKVITIKFDPVKETFDDQPLNDFCLKNTIVDYDCSLRKSLSGWIWMNGLGEMTVIGLRMIFSWDHTKPINQMNKWECFTLYDKVSSGNAADWGNGDMRKHHIWWFDLFPKIPGKDEDGYFHNWWKYYVAPTIID